MKHLAYIIVASAVCCRKAASFAPYSAQMNLYNRGLACQRTKLWAEVSMPTAENQSLPDENNDVDDILTEDPIEYSINQWREMETNALINNGLLLVIAVAVVWKVTTVNSLEMMRGWTASEMAWRVPIDNWASYSLTLSNAPIITKAVTSATVYTIGDLIAQRTEGAEMGEIDRMRTLRSLVAGLIAHGPMSHFWYDISEGLFNNILHWTEWWSFFPKVILDQTTWGPFWNNTYILLLGVMKRESLTTIWSDVKRTTVPLVVSGLKLWPLAHCVTYGLIPVENRLLWVDFVEILWVTILATQANGEVDHRESDKDM
jgi:protein Mpv17